MTCELTDRDLDQVLPLATGQLPLFSHEQGECFYPPTRSGRREFRRRMAWLCEIELLERHSVLAKLLPPDTGPVLTSEIGDPTPDFGAVAYRLQSRWTRPARRTTVFVAGRRVPALLGGVRGSIKNIFQVSHHLILARVYFSYLRTRPDLARRWVGDLVIAPTRAGGQKLPDAMLVDDDGRPYRVIESGGAYPTQRVEAFWRDCFERGLPFDLY